MSGTWSPEPRRTGVICAPSPGGERGCHVLRASEGIPDDSRFHWKRALSFGVSPWGALLAACLAFAAQCSGEETARAVERFRRAGVSRNGEAVSAAVRSGLPMPTTVVPILSCHAVDARFPTPGFCERYDSLPAWSLTDLPATEDSPDASCSFHCSHGLTLAAQAPLAHLASAGRSTPRVPTSRGPPLQELMHIQRSGSPSERELGRAFHCSVPARTRCLRGFTPEASWVRAIRGLLLTPGDSDARPFGWA